MADDQDVQRAQDLGTALAALKCTMWGDIAVIRQELEELWRSRIRASSDEARPLTGEQRRTLVTTPNRYLYLDGKLVPYADTRIHVQSTAVKYGGSVFEGLRAYWNPDHEELYVFRLKEHVDRLLGSMRLMRMQPRSPAKTSSDRSWTSSERTSRARTCTSARRPTSRGMGGGR